MTRKTLKLWAIAAAGLLVLFGLLAFIMEQLDNRRPSVVQPPDQATSFVAMLALRDLVALATPPTLELKFVTHGSGGRSGQFKHDRDPSVYRAVLRQGATSRNHIEFEMTADAEMRAALLAALRNALQNSLTRWQPNVEVSEAAWPDNVASRDTFALEYRAETEAGSYRGEIQVAIQRVPNENLRSSETDKVIHSLSVASSEDRWGRE